MAKRHGSKCITYANDSAPPIQSDSTAYIVYRPGKRRSQATRIFLGTDSFCRTTFPEKIRLLIGSAPLSSNIN